MARACASEDGKGTRCQCCRYWFERCCHALALLEGEDRTPAACPHFVSEATRRGQELETSPW